MDLCQWSVGPGCRRCDRKVGCVRGGSTSGCSEKVRVPVTIPTCLSVAPIPLVGMCVKLVKVWVRVVRTEPLNFWTCFGRPVPVETSRTRPKLTSGLLN